MYTRCILFSIIALVLALGPAARPAAAAEGFVDSNAGLPGVWNPTAAWGDVDGDGDLDLFITGETSAGSLGEVYRNDGQGGFTAGNAGLPGVYNGDVAFGDVDDDGDLDLLLVGCTDPSCRAGSARIYKNDGQGRFTDSNAGLAPLVYGAAAFGDVNGDGDLDLLLAGIIFAGLNSELSTKVYQNDGQGGFTDSNASLPGLLRSAAAFGDVDNDGDLDMVISGSTGSEEISRLYMNDGKGGFSDSGAHLTRVNDAAAAFGDVDNDGDLDLLLAGNTDAEPIAEVYKNNGQGRFTAGYAGLPGLIPSAAAFGDVDNDGALDLILAGETPEGYSTRLLLNLGDYVGWGDHPTPLPGVSGAAVFGDVDGDADLDLLLAGHTGAELIARVYRNISDTPNTPPTAPTGLQVVFNGITATLSWNAAGDAQTPAVGLTYNLRVGTTPGGSEVHAALGNIFHRTSLTVTGLNSISVYYWSVQAVDSAFAASPVASGRFVDYPGLSIGDVQITEGSAGTPTAVVNVALNGPTRRQVSVDFSTKNVSALAGRDYTAVSGTLSFPAGATRGTISVPITPDTVDEPKELFLVNLRAPVNGYQRHGMSLVTIVDDDTEPAISVDDVTVAEGNAGARYASFTVSLSAASLQPVTVGYATANGTPARAIASNWCSTKSR